MEYISVSVEMYYNLHLEFQKRSVKERKEIIS